MKPHIILLLILAAPSTAALVEEDPAGDVSGPDPAASTVHPDLDLRRLVVEDQGAEILVEVVIEELRPLHIQGITYGLEFRVGSQQYVLDIWQQNDIYGNWYWRVELVQQDGWTREPRFTVKAESGTASVWLPRNWLVDETGNPTWGATGLKDMVLSSTGAWTGFLGADVADRLPDEGALAWMPAYGVVPPQPFSVAVEQPLRQTNGGVQSFVYTLKIDGAPAGPYELGVISSPENWFIGTPKHVNVNEQGVGQAAILVSIPGAHGHGDVQEVRMALEGAEVAEFVVGVSFARPAFPTGHHPELYVHARASGDLRQAFMNTADDDPLDAGLEIPFRSGIEGGFFDYNLSAPLEPRLGMGMLVDAQRNASLDAVVRGTGTHTGITLSGQIVLLTDMERHVLWEFPRIAYLQTPGDTIPYRVNGTWVGSSALVVPENEANLVLDLVARELLPTMNSPSPVLLPGASIHLPLFDFKDDVNGYFEQVTDLRVHTEEPNIIRLRPESTAVIPVVVSNPTGSSALVTAAISESVPGWVTVQPHQVSVAPGREGVVQVVVRVPPDAVGQNEVRALFYEQGQLIGVQEFSIFVDPQADRDDPIAEDEAATRTPGFAATALLITMGIALNLQRRSRR